MVRRRSLWTLGLALGLLMLMATPAWAWKFVLVDGSGGDDAPSSIAVAADDTVGVSWMQDAGSSVLWWATRNGSSWVKTKARTGPIGIACYDPTVGPSAVFVPGTAHPRIVSVCNLDPSPYILWSLSNGGKWKTSTIDYVPGPYSARTATLNVTACFDHSTGLASVFYGDTNELGLRWVHANGSTWDAQWALGPYGPNNGVDGYTVGCAYNPSTLQIDLAVTSKRYSTATLSHVTYVPSSGLWTAQTVATDAVGIPSIAVDATGTPWIAFQEGSASASHLEVAHRVGTAWVLENVDSASTLTGIEPSASIRPSEGPKVAYYDGTNNDLKFASLLTGTWTVSTLKSAGDVGQYPSLAYNSVNNGELTYWDAGAKAIYWGH